MTERRNTTRKEPGLQTINEYKLQCRAITVGITILVIIMDTCKK